MGAGMTVSDHQERLRVLYDVERHVRETDGGILVEDPYPALAELRAKAPVHKGSVRELLGYAAGGILAAMATGPVYSLLSFDANNIALRDNDTFSSAVYAGLVTQMFGGRTILEMGGTEHRQQRALAQSAFTPKRAEWWIQRWIHQIVDDAVSSFDSDGRAELNGELCSRIPLLTITSSFGLTVDEALDFRDGAEARGMDAEQMAARQARTEEMLRRVIAERRVTPQDDLITALIQTEVKEDGNRHLLADDDIYALARLILTAGSGTTWRQLGILLVALLKNPTLLEAVRDDRTLLRATAEEAVRWEPTDPIFRRLVTKDVDLLGVEIPAGSVVEMCLGAANRDPLRWEDPERFDPYRAPQAHVGFASGPHVCLGQHVARAEMIEAVDALLDRLPNLRLDPDVPNVRIIGLEHRGPNAVPVVFDR
jgi:cytochrome P450